MSKTNPLAQFGFREVTPKEIAAEKRRQAACDHLANADHSTIEYKSSGRRDILSCYHNPRTGAVTVQCRKCGADWQAASATELGAAYWAKVLREKARSRYIQDIETKTRFRKWALEWDAYAAELSTRRRLRAGTPIFPG